MTSPVITLPLHHPHKQVVQLMLIIWCSTRHDKFSMITTLAINTGKPVTATTLRDKRCCEFWLHTVCLRNCIITENPSKHNFSTGTMDMVQWRICIEAVNCNRYNWQQKFTRPLFDLYFTGWKRWYLILLTFLSSRCWFIGLKPIILIYISSYWFKAPNFDLYQLVLV